MKIVSLKAENVKRLSAVEITPDGNMVVIGGKNGAGKSSVLDSIMYALGGQSAVAKRPIRNGQESASVTVELDDLIVTRKWTEKGSKLVVKNGDGATFSSGQAILDRLVGRLSFDPLGFSRMKPADQAATLRDLVGIDHSDLDAKRAKLYSERTDINREVKRLAGAIESTPKHDDAPEEPVSVAGLMKELEEGQAVNTKKAESARQLAELGRELADEMEGVESLDGQIADLERQLTAAKEDRADTVARRDKLKEEHADFQALCEKMPTFDCEPIHKQIAEADGINAKVRANAERANLSGQHQAEVKISEGLTAQIDAIDKQKADDLAAAEFPLDGLSFDETGVSLAGVPFEQASSAEQLRASVAIGLAMNPELRVVLIRDASLMDADSMALVAEMAAEKDAQLWVERVGYGEECTVIIQDGAVLGAQTEPVAV